MRYTFPPRPAYDPNSRELVRDGAGQVYAIDDTSLLNPLTVYDAAGNPKTTILTTPIGVSEEFATDDHDIVRWQSGDYTLVLESFEGMREAAQDAAQAAQDAAQAAQAAADNIPVEVEGQLTDPTSAAYASVKTAATEVLSQDPTVVNAAASAVDDEITSADVAARVGRPRPRLVRHFMADPPIVGAVAAATAIPSGVTHSPLTGGGGGGATPDPNAPFRYVKATNPARFGDAFPEYNYIKFANLTTPYMPTAPYGVQFIHKGTRLEIKVRQFQGYGWEIHVDGQLVSEVTVSTNTPGQAWIPLTFDTPDERFIEFRSVIPFGGVVIGPTDTISKPRRPTPRLMVVGDSYASGTGATIAQVTGATALLSDYLGWDDTINSGVGGTGYRMPETPGTTVNIAARLQNDVIDPKPDVVLFTAGHNDLSFSATLAADVEAIIAQTKTALPATLVIVSGPLFEGGKAELYTPTQNAIFAGAEAGGADLLIDTITDPIFTGTGNVGNPQGDGNSDIYIGTDGVHPTQAGHDYLARTMARWITTATMGA